MERNKNKKKNKRKAQKTKVMMMTLKPRTRTMMRKETSKMKRAKQATMHPRIMKMASRKRTRKTKKT